VSWVSDVAAEIDRLVVRVHGKAGELFASSELAKSFDAHPGLLNGIGTALVDGPVPVSAVEVIYPYLPERLRDMLVANNVEAGVVTLEDGNLVVTDAGREPARLASVLLDESADALWDGSAWLDDAEAGGMVAVMHGRSIEPPMQPSAFEVTHVLIDRPTQPGRIFRVLSALRYWRADAHRAAWSAAGLNVQEAHALNRLWDLHRGVERVGQGDERPGRTGVDGLTAKGLAATEAITDAGIAAREAIEADTDARTEPVFATLTDRDLFLQSLQNLPSD
jgi:hypothetical protein